MARHPLDLRLAAGGIVLHGDSVVLHRSRFGHVNFPKGRVKKHETPAEAAIREVAEETGLRASVVEHAGTLTLWNLPQPQRVELYLMRAIDGHLLDDHALLVEMDQVERALTFNDLRCFWRSVEPRVRQVASAAAPDS